MAKPTSTLGRFFSGLAMLYRGFRSVILNLLFIFLILLFLDSLIGEAPVMVQPGSALLLNPDGRPADLCRPSGCTGRRLPRLGHTKSGSPVAGRP